MSIDERRQSSPTSGIAKLSNYSRQKKAHVAMTWAFSSNYFSLNRRLLRGSDNEAGTAILRPASLGLLFTNRDLFTVTDRRHTIGSDT